MNELKHSKIAKSPRVIEKNGASIGLVFPMSHMSYVNELPVSQFQLVSTAF